MSFFFEAQTGLILDGQPQSRSNYYLYELPDRLRITVSRAVDHAIGSMLAEGRGTLEYPKEFLKMIEKADLKGGK